jgi:RimJ/RimL family protein N-acetyltransferase
MIKTRRLRIGFIESSDLEEVRLLHNHPDTLMWLSDTHKVTVQEQQEWFSTLINSQKSQRYVARELLSGKLVGVFRLDNLDLENESAQVGLDVALDFRRQGLATEIYMAMIPHFFGEMLLNRISLVTLESNFAARALYEKLGFVEEGRLRKAFLRDNCYIDGVIYSLLSSEYRP